MAVLTSAGENKNSTKFASGLNSHSTTGKHFVWRSSLRACSSSAWA
jgi:hypothetical protein